MVKTINEETKKAAIQYAECVKEHIYEISQKCRWGKIKGVYVSNVVLTDFYAPICEVRVAHKNNTITSVFCSNTGFEIPISAGLDAVKGMEAILNVDTGYKKWRFVVVAPEIDSEFAVNVQLKLHVEFLQFNEKTNECKYFSTLNTRKIYKKG